MDSLKRKRLIAIIVALLIIAVSVGFSMYRTSLTKILDNAAYSELSKDIRETAESGGFTSQQSVSDYITRWADAGGLEYKVDKAGNIIFNKKASDRKKKLSPTVVCVSYNYETAGENAKLLAGAAMIAADDMTSGRRTVIFFNDEQNNGTGYRSVSSKYFKNSPKVIYLDYGNSSYISRSSFARNYSSIKQML